MANVTNFDDLKRMHDLARIAKVGSKEWIDFATTMIDSFPSIYATAKAMNKRLDEMQEVLNGEPHSYGERKAKCKTT